MNSSGIPVVFDRTAVRKIRNRAAAQIRNHDFLFNFAHESIMDRLSLIRRKFPLALQIGARGPTKIVENARIEKLTCVDISEKLLQSANTNCVQADEENLPFAPASFDLVISALSLHTVNDLPGTLVQIRRILKPDGLFIGALCGGETLRELRHSLMEAEIALTGGISPRVYPFAGRQDAGSLMQRAGFALPVVDSETVTAEYSNPLKLMADLRGMGESNIIAGRRRGMTPKTLIRKSSEIYAQNFSTPGGKIEATFEVIFMTGWSPHESQQKALRPGSASARLADALGTEEKSAGEMPAP